MSRIRKRKCRHCGEFFLPDYRNLGRQKFCGKPECRKASKKESQRRWLRKPKNRDYFKGPINVQRVQEWRKAHPGYSRKKQDALQDRCSQNSTEIQQVNANFVSKRPGITDALQDICPAQPVLIGLIASITGSALQDDIATFLRSVQQLGMDILNNGSIDNKGGQNGEKVSDPPGTHPQGTKTVQLGGSPSGP